MTTNKFAIARSDQILLALQNTTSELISVFAITLNDSYQTFGLVFLATQPECKFLLWKQICHLLMWARWTHQHSLLILASSFHSSLGEAGWNAELTRAGHWSWMQFLLSKRQTFLTNSLIETKQHRIQWANIKDSVNKTNLILARLSGFHVYLLYLFT